MSATPEASTPGIESISQHLPQNHPAPHPAVAVIAVVVVYLDHGGAAGLESQIHIQNFEKAAQQETRAHQ
jgi:hypothetical protein